MNKKYSFGSTKEKNAFEYNRHARSWCNAMKTNVGHKYLEKPAMENELPQNLEGKNVICIGVGTGEELEEILKRNPTNVTGIDISEELLKIAAQKYPEVKFHVMDMMNLEFPDLMFDYVYSSLTLHYSNDWDKLLSGIYRVMKNGSEILFSTHHPVYWSQKPATGNYFTNKRGVTLVEHTAVLPGDIKIIYYNHADINSILDAVQKAGLTLIKYFAPEVIDIPYHSYLNGEIDQYENLKAINKKSPLFYIVKALK